MNEPFFVEVTGVRVELASQPEDETTSENDTGEDKTRTVTLRLVVEEAQKLKQKHKNGEAIEFDFDINKDIPVDVAKEMVSLNFWLDTILALWIELIFKGVIHFLSITQALSYPYLNPNHSINH